MISSSRLRNSGGSTAEFLIHQRAGPGILSILLVGCELKAKATAAFLNYLGANVGGHDQQRVFESTGNAITLASLILQIRSNRLNTSG